MGDSNNLSSPFRPPGGSAATAPGPIIESHPLRNLLRRDCELEGPRLVIPFLTTSNLLTLSQCSTDFVPFRLYLPRVRLVRPCGDDNFAEVTRQRVEVGVAGMLASARNLDYLVVDHPAVLPLLQSLGQGGRGCCTTRCLEINDEGVDEPTEHTDAKYQVIQYIHSYVWEESL